MSDRSHADVSELENHLVAFLLSDGSGDAAHDIGHFRRVLGVARVIAASEGAHDALVLTASALLHDCVSVAKNDPQRSQASRLAALRAAGVLRGMGFPEDRLGGVCHAIEAHSFSADIRPLSPEARALRDADRIDALGAIGIARCFAVSGAMGRPLFDPDDPLARGRDLDDLVWALDHFRVKLLRLPDSMWTDLGRRIARDRADVLVKFMSQIEIESGSGTEVTGDAAS